MNNGIYLDDDLKSSVPTNFIGVVVTLKNIWALNMRSDIHFLKKKVEGGDYIVTQMFW